MDLFHRAKAVRLRSHHDKYLVAEEDEEHVTQERNGSSRLARWSVEVVEGGSLLRLKSCYGRYLTASNEPFLLGVTGRKVLQTRPNRLDSSHEWEPIREGFQVKLKTRYGHFLRANGGLPPWRNSVTHDIPHRTATQDWILWEVDIVELLTPHDAPSAAASMPPEPQATHTSKLSKLESSSSFSGSPHKVEGRTIYYAIADDDGNVEDSSEGHSFIFNGTNVEELTHKLKEKTGLSDIIPCTRSRLDDKLHPLHLGLPPNNATMHIVVVLPSSKLVKTFPWPWNSE